MSSAGRFFIGFATGALSMATVIAAVVFGLLVFFGFGDEDPREGLADRGYPSEP